MQRKSIVKDVIIVGCLALTLLMGCEKGENSTASTMKDRTEETECDTDQYVRMSEEDLEKSYQVFFDKISENQTKFFDDGENFWVHGEEGENEYNYLVDVDGDIKYKINVEQGIPITGVTNGVFAVEKDDEVFIFNDAGEDITHNYVEENEEIVLAVDDSTGLSIWLLKSIDSYDSHEIVYEVKDSLGNIKRSWIEGEIKSNYGADRWNGEAAVKYVGGGFYRLGSWLVKSDKYQDENYQVYVNVESGSVMNAYISMIIDRVWCSADRENLLVVQDTMFYIFNKDGNLTLDYRTYPERVWLEEGYIKSGKVFVNGKQEKGFIKENGGFIDLTQWRFDIPNPSWKPEYYGKYAMLPLKNQGGVEYVTIIDEEGNALFDPVEGNGRSGLRDTCLGETGMVELETNGERYLLNLQGEMWKIPGGNSAAIVKDGVDLNYLYCGTDGKLMKEKIELEGFFDGISESADKDEYTIWKFPSDSGVEGYTEKKLHADNIQWSDCKTHYISESGNVMDFIWSGPTEIGKKAEETENELLMTGENTDLNLVVWYDGKIDNENDFIKNTSIEAIFEKTDGEADRGSVLTEETAEYHSATFKISGDWYLGYARVIDDYIKMERYIFEYVERKEVYDEKRVWDVISSIKVAEGKKESKYQDIYTCWFAKRDNAEGYTEKSIYRDDITWADCFTHVRNPSGTEMDFIWSGPKEIGDYTYQEGNYASLTDEKQNYFLDAWCTGIMESEADLMKNYTAEEIMEIEEATPNENSFRIEEDDDYYSVFFEISNDEYIGCVRYIDNLKTMLCYQFRYLERKEIYNEERVKKVIESLAFEISKEEHKEEILCGAWYEKGQSAPLFVLYNTGECELEEGKWYWKIKDKSKIQFENVADRKNIILMIKSVSEQSNTMEVQYENGTIKTLIKRE